jgi:hypothetical protein
MNEAILSFNILFENREKISVKNQSNEIDILEIDSGTKSLKNLFGMRNTTSRMEKFQGIRADVINQYIYLINIIKINLLIKYK